MRIAASKRSKSPEFLANQSKSKSNSIGVIVTDLETQAPKATITNYHAIRAAARALAIDKRLIENYIYLNQDKPVLGRYTFKLLDPKKKSLNLDIKFNNNSTKLEVTNLEANEVKIYPSIGAAARVLKCHQSSISAYLKANRNNPFKGKYFFKKL